MTEPGVLAHLPPELTYLTKPALKYGRFQFYDDIVSFLEQATETETLELATVARRVLDNNHYPRVNNFLSQYVLTEHDEAACLYFLFGVMDYAGLDFDSPPS